MNLFLTVLVTIVSCSYGAHIQTNPQQEEIIALIEEKCNKNAHNKDAFPNLMAAFEPYTQCVEGAMGYPPPNPLTDYNAFCRNIGNGQYYTCLNNLGKKVSPCLDADEKYLPDFILTAFNGSLADVCGENGFNRIQAMINDIETSNCVVTHLSMETLKSRCIDTLITYKNIINDIFTIKKDDLCSDLRSFNGCVIELLQERCHEDHTETVNLLMKAYLDAC